MELFFALKASLRPRNHLRPCRICYSATAAVLLLSLLLFVGVAHILEEGGLSRRCGWGCTEGVLIETPQTWITARGWNGSRALDKVARSWKGERYMEVQ
jgi:hypothetical protein